MHKENPLGTEKISSLLYRFSVPAIIGMMVSAFYNIVDRIYIGNAADLGSNGLAGITIGFPIMIIMISIGLLFGIGGATLFSIKLGQGKKNDAEKVLGNAFSLLIVSGILFSIIGAIFLNPLLSLFGASDAVLPYAHDYMRVIFIGATFQIVSLGLNHFVRADGKPKLAMVTMFVGAGLNIILDPIFIYVFGMGMAGAALATIISQFVSMMWILKYFLSSNANTRIHKAYLRIETHIFFSIFALGLPAFLLQIANSVLNIVLNRTLLSYGGDIAVSGMGVINSVQTLLLMPIIGLNQGVQPIISYNYGAKKYDRIEKAIKLAIIVATVIVGIGFVLTRAFPKQIVGLFNNEAALLEFGEKGIIMWFWMLPVVGFQILAANFFQAIGKPNSAMVLTLTRQVLLLIPAILVFSALFGIDGLLLAAPFADLISFLITGTWFYIGIKKISASHKEQEQKNGNPLFE